MTDEIAIELIKEVAGMKTLVEDTHERLFGNGVGVIEIHNKRIKDLEDTKQRAVGISWFMGIIISFLSLLEGFHIFKKGS